MLAFESESRRLSRCWPSCRPSPHLNKPSVKRRSHVEFVVMTHDTLQVYTNYSSKLYRDIKKSFSEIVYYQLQPGIIILTYNRKIHEVSMIHGQINNEHTKFWIHRSGSPLLCRGCQCIMPFDSGKEGFWKRKMTQIYASKS